MRYSIVLVPFPFDDLTSSKVRPAVCLTSAMGTHNHVVLAFISSVIPANLESSDLLLDPNAAGFEHTGLKVVSVLRLHRMVTVSASIIKRKLGALPTNAQTEARDRLRALFGI